MIGEKKKIFQKKTFKKKKFEKLIMNWAAIGLNYKSKIIIFEKNNDSETYAEILISPNFYNEVDCIFGKFNWFLVQDGASSHDQEKTLLKLSEYFNILPYWHPNSPDLNPIEMYWIILKKNINKEYFISESLKQIFIAKWEILNLKTTNSLIDSFPERLILLKQANCASITPLLSRNLKVVPEDYMNWKRIEYHPWTEDEDNQLKKLIEIHGNKFKLFSTIMIPRNRNEIKNRANYLKKYKNSIINIPSLDIENFDLNLFREILIKRK